MKRFENNYKDWYFVDSENQMINAENMEVVLANCYKDVIVIKEEDR